MMLEQRPEARVEASQVKGQSLWHLIILDGRKSRHKGLFERITGAWEKLEKPSVTGAQRAGACV